MSSTTINTTDNPVLPQSHPSQPRTLQEVHAATDVVGFVTLTAQIVGLLFLVHYYHLESPQFVIMSAMVFGAFIIHYWLPFRFKEIFWVAVSIGGSFVLVNHLVAALVLGIGLAIFLVLRSPLAIRWRCILVLAIFAVLIYECATDKLDIPRSFYAVFGGIFMFRIIIYIYDLAHAKGRPSLLSYLSYFFILPNYYFSLFPVIDFKTMRATYYRRNIHDIAQQGIHWMVRGAVQLMLYRVVLYFDDPYLPDRVNTLPKLIINMILTFLLYLDVSGKFHIIVGMMHLFGYDLPETNRRYLLANSFLDFWRRINIYWKDFMVKVIYLPIYFRFRKRSEFRAQIIGTIAVFVTSWAAHSYQTLWIKGQFSLGWPDTMFWGILGGLVVLNVLYDHWHKVRRGPSGWRGRWLLAARTFGVFTSITFLWFLWSSPTVTAWLYLMTRWTAGAGQ